MEKLGWRDRRISPDSGSLFQTFPRAEKQFNGAALELNISSIKVVAARFEEIQFSENFDSIILA